MQLVHQAPLSSELKLCNSRSSLQICSSFSGARNHTGTLAANAMASSIPISRFGIYSSVCERCSTLLAPSSRAPQKRRLSALTTQKRGISSGRTSLSPRDLYEATSSASRRHDAASWLLYPGSKRRATPSTTSYNALLLREPPRSHFSTTSTVAENAASSPAQSARPEPPDYLDEKERAIFDRLNEELQPIELQVCIPP